MPSTNEFELEPGVRAVVPSEDGQPQQPRSLQRMLFRALFEHGWGRRLATSSNNAHASVPPRPAPVEMREATAEEIDEGATCRFCFDASAEEPLIAPCSCQGSSLWVHKSCLIKWQRASMKAGTGHERVCNVCGTTFALPPPAMPSAMAVRAGMLLVASSDLGGTFCQAVILLCEVNSRGAHGVIINQHIRGEAPMCASSRHQPPPRPSPPRLPRRLMRRETPSPRRH